MSLKRAKDRLLRGQISPRPWSLTARLTWFYSLSCFAMLSLASVFLYWALARGLEVEDRLLLADEIQILHRILKEQPDNAEILVQEIKGEGGEIRATPVYARILDAQGRTQIETPGMGGLLPATLFPAPINATQIPGSGIKHRSNDGKHYLLTAIQAKLGRSPTAYRIIQMGLDSSHDEAMLAEYRRNLTLVLTLGGVFSAGVGALIARHGMRPLLAITRTAERITASRLHARIGAAQWPQELAALASAFDDMLMRLEDAFNRLSQFSMDLAHELRTPINNLMGETEVALSKVRSPEEYRHILESNLEEYGKLSRVIGSLLFLARAESARAPMAHSQLNARDEIEALLDYYAALAEEQGVKVTCEGKACLYADPTLFGRAVSNLLANALQHTPCGGIVVLSVTEREDHTVEISVKDNGAGIPSQHLPKVFDRFYRVDTARAQHPVGAGLGLAIVKSIMALHDGSVTIQSKTGEGTLVTLRFPPADTTK
jgi:two-component system heavy metal sensor histidine kinase CusS